MTNRHPTTVSVEDAGALLGVSRTTAYRLASSGEFPVPVIRVGKKLRIPTAMLADALGLQPNDVIERVRTLMEDEQDPAVRPGRVL